MRGPGAIQYFFCCTFYETKQKKIIIKRTFFFIKRGYQGNWHRKYLAILILKRLKFKKKNILKKLQKRNKWNASFGTNLLRADSINNITTVRLILLRKTNHVLDKTEWKKKTNKTNELKKRTTHIFISQVCIEISNRLLFVWNKKKEKKKHSQKKEK